MPPLINRQLFAEAYLRGLRAQRLAQADVLDGRRQTIKEWREEYSALDQRDPLLAYLRQCLSTLGLAYQQHTGPDHFLLFADPTFARPLGLVLTVTDDQIGRMTKGRHHQWRLIKLLREHKLTWGVLTNGRDWRLCNANLSAPYEVWLEIRLDDLLESARLPEFALFDFFFGHDAFAPAEGDESRQGLDVRWADSEKRTQAIEKHLKGRVESISQNLCLGFVQDEGRPNLTRADLDWIYRNAIYLLYRILFLFYAEARQLLPTARAPYAAIGLDTLVEAARLRQHEGVLNPDEYALWKRLTQLCVVVDDGDEALGVRPYNGGLFSDHENPYLRDHKMTDAYLAPALFNLAFVEGKGEPQRIDYRDLSVRHLGTLYEGLLEYKLNLVTDEPVVVRESKNKRQYVPMSAAGSVRRTETILEKGQAYFADDKGERKSSGSYYTPEDGVQYITGNTVLPKARERAAPVAKIVAEAERARAEATSEAERRRVEQYADQRILELVEKRLLSLRVLDPAMGSAHFLVADGQIITNIIVETLNAGDWLNDGVNTDPLFWKRRVVERCLYGVDVNPLSQELAKLALWLTSASEGKPLTFLDHHLKHGNSLYGAPLKRLSSLPIKKPMPDAPTTTDFFQAAFDNALTPILYDLMRITAVDSEHIEDVKAKDEAYQHIKAAAQRLRDVANVWLGTLFGLTVNTDAYTALLEAAARAQTPEEWETYAATHPLIPEARKLAETHHFFHWELEFPDAVDATAHACRFDAVTANPPYVGTSPDTAIIALYETAKCGDLYAWIVERSLSVLSSQGTLGVVVPLSVMFSKGMTPLRGMFLSNELRMNLSSYDNRPESFFNADKSIGASSENRQRTCVILAYAGHEPQVHTTDFLQWRAEERNLLFVNHRYSDVTRITSKRIFPKIGKSLLVDFWLALSSTDTTLSSLSSELLSESRRPAANTLFLTIPRAAYHYISATPGYMRRNKVLSAVFKTESDLKLAQVLINSNVFFWYWRAFGDGFLLSVDILGGFPLFTPKNLDYLDFSRRLDLALEECTVYSKVNGESVPSYNFNKRMDILLDIDAWIVRHVAPDLGLPRDIFAQYKSNSFLRPLDLTALTMQANEGVDDEEADI
jgi:hypothetical protein